MKKAAECVSWPEKYATKQPTRAVAAAVGAGFLLNLLPISKIVGALTGAVLTFARPLLLGVGVLKICDYCRPASEPRENLGRKPTKPNHE